MSTPITQAIRARRTHKRFSGAAVARATVEELLELGTWAPNHRLSNPWRFHVLDPDAIVALGDWLATRTAIVEHPDPEKGRRKLAKLREHYFPQLAAMIQVTYRRHSDPAIDAEDLAATAAAVQNILLGAEARELAAFWSSSAALRHPETLRHLGADPEEEGFVASIWLGGRVEEPTAPDREPLDAVTRWSWGS